MKLSFCYTELPCYFWMLYTVIASPGVLYMVYPLLLFGYVIVEEQSPGRFFWYGVIIYTQLLILVTFAM